MAVLFMVPYIPGKSPVCWNGVYEAVCIVVVFPVLLWLGASDRSAGKRQMRMYNWLGELSYPLYIVHYPLFFTLYGSYSGKKLDKKGGWFYFGQGKFYNSKNLGRQYDYVNVRPFRAYFAHEFSSGAKLMVGFNVAFGDALTTGIDNLSVDTSAEGLQLSTSHGQLTMKASEPTDYSHARNMIVYRVR